MTRTRRRHVTHVTSTDGTEIAVFVSGQRPAARRRTRHDVRPHHLAPRAAAARAPSSRSMPSTGEAAARVAMAPTTHSPRSTPTWPPSSTRPRPDRLPGGPARPLLRRQHRVRRRHPHHQHPQARSLRGLASAEHRAPHLAPEVMEHLEALLAQGQPEQMLETLLPRDREAAGGGDRRHQGRLHVAGAGRGGRHRAPRDPRLCDQAFDPAWAARIPHRPCCSWAGTARTRSRPTRRSSPPHSPTPRSRSWKGRRTWPTSRTPETFAGHVLAFLRDEEGGEH